MHLQKIAESRRNSDASGVLVPTLFHQEWWLKLASRDAFGIAEVSATGRVVGRLPYTTRRRAGFKAIYMPPITHVLGPAVDVGSGGTNTRFLKRLTVTRELLRMLPRASTVRLKLHRDITETLAFQAEGFFTSVVFCHEIPPTAHDQLWKNMRDKTRNVIRLAERSLTVAPLDDVDAFLHFYGKNLTATGRGYLNDPQVCRDLIAASLDRGCGRILSVRGADGKLEAATFVAWDDRSAYYLMSTRAQGSSNGAISLLLWEMIKFATSRGLIFDFAGVASSGAILLYAGFGGHVRPCYIVERSTGPFRALQAMNRLRSDGFPI